MTDKYAKLREAAEKATPGPWDHDGPESSIIVWSSENDRVCFMTSDGPAKANAAYIAAANPQVVLALLDHLAAEKARADAAEARVADLENLAMLMEAEGKAAEATISTLTAERDALKRERDEAREEAFIAGWERGNSGFGTLDPVHEYDEYRSALSDANAAEREGNT